MKGAIALSIAACLFLLSGCTSPAAIPAPTSIPSATPLPPILTNTPAPTLTAVPVALPLSAPGPYRVGLRRSVAFKDPSRNGREVTITVWYPADLASGAATSEPVADAGPDLSRAPYPVVLSSTKVGFYFAPHLASYGFVVVGVNGQDSKEHWGQWLTDYPLDIVFALKQLAANPVPGLEGVLDTDHAGAMGYSFDGYTALALSGARVDPESYLARCSGASSMESPPPEWWIGYICDLNGGWDAFVSNAGPRITTSSDGLWQPMTDPRIRAVLPMAPEGAWLFGERGLAAVDRPTLIIAATGDTINLYGLEAAYIFDHLGTPDRAMVSFVGEGHMMIENPERVARMQHFAVAFFGYHLRGQTTYADYLSKEFIAGYPDLAWGKYPAP